MPHSKNHFSSDSEFDLFMREVDSEMRADDIPITAREINGLFSASSRLKADLRLMPLPKRGPISGIYAGDDLSLRILSWFQTKYGDRLKADFSPGMVPVLIEGDPYLMRLPRVFGRIRLVCDVATHGKPVGSPLGVKAPPVHNVLDSVQGLTSAVSAALSHRDLEALADCFRSASESFSWMERPPEDELIDAALADLAAAANATLGRTSQDIPLRPFAVVISPGN